WSPGSSSDGSAWKVAKSASGSRSRSSMGISTRSSSSVSTTTCVTSPVASSVRTSRTLPISVPSCVRASSPIKPCSSTLKNLLVTDINPRNYLSTLSCPMLPLRL
ncbi:hypothetical protein AVDCRST_MAG82-436, partial [uncultured Rubrobacteraceae bacterium]